MELRMEDVRCNANNIVGPLKRRLWSSTTPSRAAGCHEVWHNDNNVFWEMPTPVTQWDSKVCNATPRAGASDKHK